MTRWAQPDEDPVYESASLPGELWHVTALRNVPSILRDGLLPTAAGQRGGIVASERASARRAARRIRERAKRAKRGATAIPARPRRRSASYPPRVYCFLQPDYLFDEGPRGPIAHLCVDRRQIPDAVWYYDPEFVDWFDEDPLSTAYAVYTKSAIPASAISVYETFDED